MKHEHKSIPSQKGVSGIDHQSAQELNLQRWVASVPRLPDLKFQTLTGHKVIPPEYPFRIYEINNKVSLHPPSTEEEQLNSSVIAEITKDGERNYFISTEVLAHIDSSPINSDTKITHGSKISFGGKLYARDGGHIVICIFAKDYIQEKSIDVSHLAKNQSQSVFLPKRCTNYSVLVPMEARIIHSKWNFEERDQLK
jgi:hypothetical protein